MTVHDYLQAYYTPQTVAAYEREIAFYLSNYPAAAHAAYPDITAYIGGLRKRYHNAATLTRIVASIKAYYSYLCHSGQREDNPAKSIRLRDQRSRDIQLQDLLTITELEALLHRPECYNRLALRNQVLISLLIYQALQPAAIAAIAVNDVYLEAGRIRIRGSGKTNSRELPLQSNQVLLFYQYMTEARLQLLQGNTCELLLIGQRGQPMQANDIIKHVQRSYGNRYPGRVVSAQTIRQGVITHLLQQGHDISRVQGFAGHKYPSATEKYKQNEIETLHAAIHKYHPVQ